MLIFSTTLLLLCALISVVLCFNARSICIKFGMMDIPDARKLHAVDTPLMGGILVLSVLVPVITAYTFLVSSERWFPSIMIWILCVAGMAMVGIADDRHSLSPRSRLFLSFIIFGFASFFDPTFNVRLLDFELIRFTIGLGSNWTAVIFTIICCVGLVNAVNMADGKNGLAIGLSIGWVIFLAGTAPEPLWWPIAFLLSVLFILLIFNLNGRLFLGDGGAYAIASAVGLLAIMLYNSPGVHSLRAISADELILLFFVPVFDSFRLTYVRMKRGQSPMTADRDHLHHHLQNRFGWPNGLIIYLCIAIGPAAVVRVMH